MLSVYAVIVFYTHSFHVSISRCFCSFLCALQGFNPVPLLSMLCCCVVWSASSSCYARSSSLSAQLFKASTKAWLTAPSSSSLLTWSLWTLTQKKKEVSRFSCFIFFLDIRVASVGIASGFAVVLHSNPALLCILCRGFFCSVIKH